MDVFVARQPIFDSKLAVVSYELLFRNGFQNYFYGQIDGDQATSSVLTHSFCDIGIEELTSNQPAFINFTEKLLLDEIPFIFNPHLLVVEILEDVEPTPNIIATCQKLKKSGYRLALDDFVFHDKFLPLIELADIIKVDFLATPLEECARLCAQYASENLIFLAEKIEDRTLFNQAKEMGYSLFQGYFFCKPEIVTAKAIEGYKFTTLQILKEINKPTFDFNAIEQILKTDVSLSYKLLKLINSSFFGLRQEVTSLKQTMVLLGAREIKRWINLIALNNMGEDKPTELLINSICRAKFCEEASGTLHWEKRSSDLFLLGLFSRLDALVDRPMEELLKTLPLPQDIKEALMNEPNPFHDLLGTLESQELGQWDQCLECSKRLPLKESEVTNLYLKSLEYSNQLFSQIHHH